MERNLWSFRPHLCTYRLSWARRAYLTKCGWDLSMHFFTWSAHVLRRRITANPKHLYNICTMLDQRLRRWSNIVQMPYKCFGFARIASQTLLPLKTWNSEKPTCILTGGAPGWYWWYWRWECSLEKSHINLGLFFKWKHWQIRIFGKVALFNIICLRRDAMVWAWYRAVSNPAWCRIFWEIIYHGSPLSIMTMLWYCFDVVSFFKCSTPTCFTCLRCKGVPCRTEMALCMASSMRRNVCRTVGSR